MIRKGGCRYVTTRLDNRSALLIEKNYSVTFKTFQVMSLPSCDFSNNLKLISSISSKWLQFDHQVQNIGIGSTNQSTFIYLFNLAFIGLNLTKVKVHQKLISVLVVAGIPPYHLPHFIITFLSSLLCCWTKRPTGLQKPPLKNKVVKLKVWLSVKWQMKCFQHWYITTDLLVMMLSLSQINNRGGPDPANNLVDSGERTWSIEVKSDLLL